MLKKKKKRADQQPSPKKYGPRFAPQAGGFPAAGLQAAFLGRRFEPALSTVLGGLCALGLCFTCVDMGHLRNNCPKTAGSRPTDGSRTWYPPQCTVVLSGLMHGWVPGQDLSCGQATVVTMPVGGGG